MQIYCLLWRQKVKQSGFGLTSDRSSGKKYQRFFQILPLKRVNLNKKKIFRRVKMPKNRYFT